MDTSASPDGSIEAHTIEEIISALQQNHSIGDACPREQQDDYIVYYKLKKQEEL